MSPVTLDDPSAYFERLDAFERGHWWSGLVARIARDWLDDALRGRSGLVALDVGCGAGFNLGRLAGRREVARVVGVEPSPEALARAAGRGHPVVRGSALVLPFGDGLFDLAACLDVLQHLPPGGIVGAVGELARVVRPGGLAIVRTNAGGRDGLRPEVVRSALARSGFEVRRATRVNVVGSVVQECRGRLSPGRHRAEPSGAGLPAPGPGAGGRLMAVLGRAEAFAIGRLGWTSPIGHSAMFLAVRRGGVGLPPTRDLG